jgi:prepilin-type N-terminal cleavage/methylation domain-containing protein
MVSNQNNDGAWGPSPIGMRANYKRPNRTAGMRGVSLVELVIVVTIILILSAIAIPHFTQIWYGTQLHASASEVANLMQQARINAARANATYPVRFRMNNNLQQAYIDLNNNSSWDSGEPLIDLPSSITGASGAPNGTAGTPTAYVLVGDSSTGTPFDNSNVIAYSPRGLPCNYTSGTCTTPAASYFVYYFTDSRNGGWAGVLVTKSGLSKPIMWNGGAWR